MLQVQGSCNSHSETTMLAVSNHPIDGPMLHQMKDPSTSLIVGSACETAFEAGIFNLEGDWPGTFHI